MADSNDPRKFLQKPCPDGAAPQQRKSNFFSTLGKIGDLEILNNVDNEIGQGLRALETISNQIRLGEGAPKVFTDPDTSQEAGEDAVLDPLGIDPNQTRTEGIRFNPTVANRALGQANAIYERVRQGNFEIRDIPEAIQDFGNLKQLLGGIFTPLSGENNKSDRFCDPSPYAVDLIALAPKHKFMFVVEFVFSSDYIEEFRDHNFAFVIKRSSRPNMNFEYEDVNFYNFRTKVLKKSEYQPMTMTFYDDMTDNALRFYARYMQIISPISRSVGDGTSTMFEESGMTFDQSEGAVNSASINAVGNTTKTIIDYINLYHIVHAGRDVDVYRFDNPRLQTMSLDDLDMTDGGTGTEVTIEFNYDGLLIAPAQDIHEFASKITAVTSGGLYPLVPHVVPSADGVSSTTTKIDDQTPSTADDSIFSFERREELRQQLLALDDSSG